MAIYVLAEALHQAGVTDLVGKVLVKLTGSKTHWLVVIVMLAGAGLSLFMNNIAAASVLLPAVSGAAHKSRYSLSRLLMPLAFATILGGMATLLTTTNIIVSSLLRDRGLVGFGLLDFLPLGIPIVITGIAYMIFASRRLLPAQSPVEQAIAEQPAASNLLDIYRLGERLVRGRLHRASILIGKPLRQSDLRQKHNLNVVAVERRSQVILSPSPDLLLEGEDVIIMEGRPGEVSEDAHHELFEILPASAWREENFESLDILMLEAVLAPRSPLIGKTLSEMHFREKYHTNVLAIWRAGQPIRTRLTDLPLNFGDALLLQCPRGRLPLLRTSPDLILLSSEQERPTPVNRKTWLALLMGAVTLALAATGLLPVGEVMMAGALAMVLVRLITMDQAYQSIEWKSIFLVAGMLPMGVAMTKTGAAAYLASQLTALLGPAGPAAVLAGLFILTVLLTQAINGAAVVVILAPVAMDAAVHLGADPRSMAMGIALAASMAFITPLGHPVNILVMGPAGYRFRDFIRVGLPLTILISLLILLLLPVFWPL